MAVQDITSTDVCQNDLKLVVYSIRKFTGLNPLSHLKLKYSYFLLQRIKINLLFTNLTSPGHQTS